MYVSSHRQHGITAAHPPRHLALHGKPDLCAVGDGIPQRQCQRAQGDIVVGVARALGHRVQLLQGVK